MSFCPLITGYVSGFVFSSDSKITRNVVSENALHNATMCLLVTQILLPLLRMYMIELVTFGSDLDIFCKILLMNVFVNF